MGYNVKEIRKDFEQLKEENIYLDTAATALKPNVVINAIKEYYIKFNGNSHSKMSIYGDKTSELIENTRNIVARYINSNKRNIIFTKSATESLNTCIFGIEDIVKEDDEILLTILEHHANIVPYQILSKEKNTKIKVVDPAVEIVERATQTLSSLNLLNDKKEKGRIIFFVTGETYHFKPTAEKFLGKEIEIYRIPK